MIIKVFELLRQVQVFSVYILRVELVDPSAHVDGLGEKEHEIFVVARLVTVIDDGECVHGALDDLDEKHDHVRDLLVHDVQRLHRHVRIMLVALQVDHRLQLTLVHLLKQELL